MSNITKETVIKIAKLAKIQIEEDKIPETMLKLDSIISWIDKFQEVDVENVEPMITNCEFPLNLAKDTEKEGDLGEKLFKNAANHKYNFFSVPKVIE